MSSGLQGSQETAAPEAGPELTAESDDAAEQDVRIPSLELQLAERTADLQRLQAEYVNYKRRVDRDRQTTRETASATVLSALLPVLDDIDRARAHGELEGGFKAVAESLERIVATLGLERFGTAGEPFDPRIHEALMHDYADTVDRPTASAILQPGYRVGDRVVRAARVAVTEPATPPEPPAEEAQAPTVEADEAEAPTVEAGTAETESRD